MTNSQNPSSGRGAEGRGAAFEPTSEERDAALRALLDNLVVGIITFDEKGNIEEANGVAERMFGYAHDELIGKTLPAILPPSVDSTPDGQLSWLTGGGEATTGELSLEWRAASASSRVANLIGRCKDGSTFPMQVSVTEIKHDRRRRFTAVIHNLTKKWRLEEDLRQAQKLQIVGRLVSSITHDFNNLLMGVGGCIDIARSKLEQGHPALKFLDEAKRAMTTRMPLARPLLMFIRQEEKRFVSSEVDAVIEYNKEMLRRLLGSDIELRLHLHAPEARVSCPEGAIEEILMNLSANARDAMAQGGFLHIDTKVLLGKHLLLQVSSRRNPAETEEDDYFKEMLKAAKEVKQRTAVALATVCSIVKRSDGSLSVGFERELGLVLSIIFPLSREIGQSAHSAPRPVVAPYAESLVLLVAADDENRPGFRKSLEHLGYKVMVASDGNQALSLCRQAEHRIDLLILDLDVAPRGQASQLKAEIAALSPDLTTIYVTNDSTESMIRGGRVSNGSIVLRKPLSEVALHAALVLALGGRALLPPDLDGSAAH